MPLLEIHNLTVEFPTAQGTLRAVDGVELVVDAGEIVGIVGESGGQERRHAGGHGPCLDRARDRRPARLQRRRSPAAPR